VIDLEDVGILDGVGKGYQKRYPLKKGQSYRHFAEEYLEKYLSGMTADEIDSIPTLQWVRAKLVAEHNEVCQFAFCSNRCFFYITNYINNISLPTTQINTLVVA
jgi:hypothetical protein